MPKEYQNRLLARFVLNTSYDEVGDDNIDQLKRHLLDALGSLFHASAKPAIHKMVRQMKKLGEGGPCKVPLLSKLPADRAAQLFTALIRYPDFMDNFLGKEATCHPSDNIGSLLAVAQLQPTDGKSLLAAMALAYQIECRLVLEIPVMKEGIDHTLLLAYSLVCGIARLMGLSEEQTANALGMAGTSISPMVTSRASYTYEWKGFASSLDALDAVNICFLAAEDMTGPIAVFEGPKGFDEVFGMKLNYNWDKENYALLPRCILKTYNAEVHSQSVLEGVLDIRKAKSFDPSEIESVHITTFLTAYHIIGGGAYGDRKKVDTKEQADHSLPYLVAVALLDGEVYPEQLTPERINRPDVQQLLRKVQVGTGFPLHQPVTLAGLLDPYTQAYPDEMRAKVVVKLIGGRSTTVEKKDYHGFFTRPFTWDDTIRKFKRLAGDVIDADRQERVIDLVRNLDRHSTAELIDLISIAPDHSHL